MSVPKLAVFLILAALSNAYAQQTSNPAAVASERPEPLKATVKLGEPIQIIAPDIPDVLADKTIISVFSATLTTMGVFTDVAFAGGNVELKDAGADAISQWRYTACTIAGSPVDARVYVIINSDRGDVSTSVELDPAYPTQPQEPVEKQISKGELFRAHADGVESPRAIYEPDPEYPELARKAKFQGSVALSVIVGADGTVKDVWVTKEGGLGLDQKSVETIRRWKFRPGTKDGLPVAVLVSIETSFRLF